MAAIEEVKKLLAELGDPNFAVTRRPDIPSNEYYIFSNFGMGFNIGDYLTAEETRKYLSIGRERVIEETIKKLNNFRKEPIMADDNKTDAKTENPAPEVSKEARPITEAEIKKKIVELSQQLNINQTRAANLRNELTLVIQRGQEIVGAIKGLQDLMKSIAE